MASTKGTPKSGKATVSKSKKAKAETPVTDEQVTAPEEQASAPDAPQANEEQGETTQAPDVQGDNTQTSDEQGDDTTPPEETEAPQEPEAPADDRPFSQQRVEDVLTQYRENMRPGMAIGEEAGAREQRKLADMLVNNVFSVPENEFKDNMRALLTFIESEREGVFHERYAYRFMGSVVMPKERRDLFEDLLTLSITTADAGPKQTANQIDLNKILERLANEQMIENIRSFYNVG